MRTCRSSRGTKAAAYLLALGLLFARPAALATVAGAGGSPVGADPVSAPRAVANDTAGESSLASAPEAGPALPRTSFRESLLAIRLNNRNLLEFASVLQDDNGRFYTTADVFMQARLRLPARPSTRLNGREYFLLDGIRGITCRLDEATQTLQISASPEVFISTVTDAMNGYSAKPVRPEAGFVLNHDFQLTRAAQTTAVSGVADAGFFSRWGVLNNRVAIQNVFAGTPSVSRLDTQFVRDFPDRMATLSIGDTVSAGGIWARQVYYAGIRWASKFSTQPGFAPVSLPTLDGQVAEPSTIDVYVNGQRTLHQPVDPGPFAIHNVPVITGQGDLQIVVTDILGRQQVVTRSYISTAELLRKGVSDYAYEAGTLRQGSLLRNSYSSVFIAATHRRGLTEKLTVNGHAEVLAAQQTLGAGIDYGWMPLGVVSFGAAFSHANAGAGGMTYAQIQHRERSFGFSGLVQLATNNFRQLGMALGERAAALQVQAQLTHSLGNRGSVGLGYLSRKNRSCLVVCQQGVDRPDVNAITASSSVRLGGRTYLAASANYSPSFKPHAAVTISLVVPLGRQHTLSAETTLQGDHPASTVDFAKQLGPGTDYGYRLRTSIDDHSQIDSAFSYQNSRGMYEVQASQGSDGPAWRLHEAGTLAWMHTYVLISRSVGDSFAVVQVPETRGVRVFANNQLIGTTDGRGLLVVPSLVPYQRNTVRLDDAGVSLDREIELADKLAVPMFHTGVFVKFNAEALGGALLRLVTSDGSPVPLGARVSVNGESNVTEVAFHGEAYIQHITFPIHLIVRWDGGGCEVRLPTRPPGNPLLPIGPLLCKEVR